MPRKLDGTYIQTGSITTTQLSSAVTTQISAGGGPRVSSLSYPGNDTAANTVGGQTVYIVGSGFETNNAIYINGNAVPSKSFISASNVSFTTPALSAGIYPVYFINTDTGATAIFVPGLSVSAEPAWVTGASLSEIGASDAWNISLSATGDAPITYALANGSSLPTGVTLAANGLISGTITSPPETDTTYTFTVVATDAQNQDSSRQFSITTSVGEGVLFANNVLLIHANGTNNQNNHAFLDSSNNNYSITRNGNVSQGSFSPFSQTGWSYYFDGDGDFISPGYNSNFTFGSGNFTVECWVHTQATGTIAGIWDDSSTNPQSWIISSANRGSTSAANINFTIDVAGTDTLLMSALQPMNKWFHLAVTRNGSSWYMFMDGVQVATATSSATISAGDGGRGLNLGGYDGASQSHKWGMNGYISNFRIVKGNALYTSAFTPPTSPLTAVANTTLLTCQNNRFIDNSTNAYSITGTGNVSVQAFSPFAPTAAYSTSTVGGSAYFDGSGDNLELTSAVWTGLAGTSTSFTVEAWVYQTGRAAQASDIIGINLSGYTTAVSFRIGTDGTLSFGDWGSGYTGSSSGTIPLRAWTHIAASKSGSTMRLFINGVLTATTTITNASIANITNTQVGGRSGNDDTRFFGYISGLRVVNGEALYTSTFTPPTSPPTNIANTTFLLNSTNAGIFDQTSKTILETVGDAKISTTQYKYGTASMYFDGTTDCLQVRTASPILNFGTGDFTIEFWMYPVASTGDNGIWDSRNADLSATGFTISYTDTEKIQFYSDTQKILGTITVSLNTWAHIAVTRSGTSLRLFVNGVLDGNVSNSQNFTDTNITIGRGVWTSSEFEGYLDDFRVTKGYARYTSNFSAPTAAFRDK
jgi:hypothetical protein